VTSIPPPEARALFGVSLSPRSYGAADFTRFLELAAEAGSALRSGGDWSQLGDDNGPARVVAQLAPQRGMKAVVEANFFDQHSGQLKLDIFDAAVRDDLVSKAAEFARANRPAYFGLGVEINTLWEHDPEAFDIFADHLFPAAARAVREASPQTQVFTTFQLERLRGLQGGLFGGVNDSADAAWELLARFPDADLISFTTYPGLVFPAVAEVPDDYYDEIAVRTDKPYGFTEAGWAADQGIAGWESDAAAQAEFVRWFTARVLAASPRLVMWSFLFDQPDAPAPFDTSGLFDSAGNQRPAWQAWLDARKG
jgi:hypothetical protein